MPVTTLWCLDITVKHIEEVKDFTALERSFPKYIFSLCVDTRLKQNPLLLQKAVVMWTVPQKTTHLTLNKV